MTAMASCLPKTCLAATGHLGRRVIRMGLYLRAAVPLCRWQMYAPPILYSFRRCPYEMRGRMALIASGVSYEHREILLSDNTAVMWAASHKGPVHAPVHPTG